MTSAALGCCSEVPSGATALRPRSAANARKAARTRLRGDRPTMPRSAAFESCADRHRQRSHDTPREPPNECPPRSMLQPRPAEAHGSQSRAGGAVAPAAAAGSCGPSAAPPWWGHSKGSGCSGSSLRRFCLRDLWLSAATLSRVDFAQPRKGYLCARADSAGQDTQWIFEQRIFSRQSQTASTQRWIDRRCVLRQAYEVRDAPSSRTERQEGAPADTMPLS